jgi:tight adherence protein C
MIRGVLALVFVGIGFLVFRAMNTILIYKLLVFVLFLYVPVFGPKYYVRRKVKSRKENILRELPEVIDLLLVSVEAGMGLDAAIMRLYAKGKIQRGASELACRSGTAMGLSRKNSLRKGRARRRDRAYLLCFRSDSGVQLGVSMKNVLAAHCERLRENAVRE